MKRFLLFCFCLMAVMGCQKNNFERQYEQVIIEAPSDAKSMIANPHVNMNMDASLLPNAGALAHSLRWQTPSAHSITLAPSQALGSV